MTQTQYENQKKPSKLGIGTVTIKNYTKNVINAKDGIIKAIFYVKIKLSEGTIVIPYIFRNDRIDNILFAVDKDGNPNKPSVFKLPIKEFNELKTTLKSFINERKEPKFSAKKKTGLKKPVTKGLTTLCAKTVGVEGRRKKDGTVKKNHVVKKGGKVVATKKKVVKK